MFHGTKMLPLPVYYCCRIYIFLFNSAAFNENSEEEEEERQPKKPGYRKVKHTEKIFI